MDHAPIVLFTYKRLDTLKQTVDALKSNSLAAESDLFIFSDAAKHVKDEPVVNEVRAYLKQISGFKSVTITEAKKNMGLANSIIAGVSEVIRKYNKAIVLEDDLVTSDNFLLFMNTCLVAYEQAEKVFSISGYSLNLGTEPGSDEDAYFLSRGWSWGWATWRSRWEKVDWAVGDYAKFRKNLKSRRAFSKGGSDLNAMLKKQMTGKLDSWGVRWVYHQFKIGGLTLYPVNSKVFNTGFDSEATHTTGSAKRYIPKMDNGSKKDFKLPQKVEINNYFQNTFQRKMGIAERFKSKISTGIMNLLKKINKQELNNE